MMKTRHDGKAPSQRQLRVGEELRHVIAQTLERGEIRNPVLSERLITITEVRVSPDLHNATAFVVAHGSDDQKPVFAALERIIPYLRRKIAGQMHLRTVPNLSFEADASFEQAARIEALLHSPEVRRDLEPDEP